MSTELTREKFEAWKLQTGKSHMDKNDWTEWYNCQPGRKTCPICDEPVFLNDNENGEMIIDLKHKANCNWKEKI
jgi:hypothetical protein